MYASFICSKHTHSQSCSFHPFYSSTSMFFQTTGSACSRTTKTLLLAVLGVLISCCHGQQGGALVDCPLCADPTFSPQDPQARFVAGTEVLDCQTAFDLGNLTLPQENCTFWQNRGETICQCAAGPPAVNQCQLCEDGTPLPDPLRAALPGTPCVLVQVAAQRDEMQYCPVYQETFGVYCGCHNNNNNNNPNGTANVCRLCGGTNELPDPLMTVSFTRNTIATSSNQTSCVELEFAANLPDADCAEFQLLYQKSCCPTPPSKPTTSSGGSPVPGTALSIWIWIASIAGVAGGLLLRI